MECGIWKISWSTGGRVVLGIGDVSHSVGGRVNWGYKQSFSVSYHKLSVLVNTIQHIHTYLISHHVSNSY
jgi:hypothetical protein